jgi:hypothetical protein
MRRKRLADICEYVGEDALKQGDIANVASRDDVFDDNGSVDIPEIAARVLGI